jgi:hypothetical protein
MDFSIVSWKMFVKPFKNKRRRKRKCDEGKHGQIYEHLDPKKEKYFIKEKVQMIIE